MDSRQELDVIKVEKMWMFHNFVIQAVGLEEEAILQAEMSIINVLKNCGGMFLVGVFMFHNLFYIMEESGILDPASNSDLF